MYFPYQKKMFVFGNIRCNKQRILIQVEKILTKKIETIKYHYQAIRFRHIARNLLYNK